MESSTRHQTTNAAESDEEDKRLNILIWPLGGDVSCTIRTGAGKNLWLSQVEIWTDKTQRAT